MLAINHVTLATAATFGLSVYFNVPFFLPFISFVVFASLMPDVDHPGSEISNFIPLVNKILPHRGVTHSFVGTGLFGGGLYMLLGYDKILSIVLLVAALIGVHYLEKLIEHRLRQVDKIAFDIITNGQIKFLLRIVSLTLNIFLLLLCLLIWKDTFRQEILALLLVGYFAHLLGDFVTKEGIPLMWPHRKKYGLRLFRTGSGLETLVGFGLFIANVYLIYVFWNQFGLNNSEYWQSYVQVTL